MSLEQDKDELIESFASCPIETNGLWYYSVIALLHAMCTCTEHLIIAISNHAQQTRRDNY
jgi:hypothetical protein